MSDTLISAEQQLIDTLFNQLVGVVSTLRVIQDDLPRYREAWEEQGTALYDLEQAINVRMRHTIIPEIAHWREAYL